MCVRRGLGILSWVEARLPIDCQFMTGPLILLRCDYPIGNGKHPILTTPRRVNWDCLAPLGGRLYIAGADVD
jgi:hypothetical protein